MKKDEFKDKIFLVTYGIILFVLLMNYQWVFDLFGVVVKALLPFIVGLVIAFILNVLMKMIEEKMLYKLNKGKRALSLVLSLIAVFGFIVVLLFILIPQVKNAGMIFLDNIPEYHENILELGEKVGLSEEQLSIIKLEDTKFMKEMSNILKNNSLYRPSPNSSNPADCVNCAHCLKEVPVSNSASTSPFRLPSSPDSKILRSFAYKRQCS
jgi:predicted PurR-regulated permease PerM